MNLRTYLTLSALVLFLGFGYQANAQGLLGIGTHGSEITEASPLKVSVGIDAGYDHERRQS